MNFSGTGVTVTNPAAGYANVAIPGASAGVTFQTQGGGEKESLSYESGTVVNRAANILINNSNNEIKIGGTNGLVISGDGMYMGDTGNDLAVSVFGYGSTLANAAARTTWEDGDISNYFSGTIRQTFRNNQVQFTNGGLIVGGTTATTTVGLIRATNDVIAFYSSDRRLKTNILNIPNALEKVSMLNGVTFEWLEFDENKNKEIHANEGTDVGVIAQDVEAVFPDLVDTRESGYKAVKYDKLVAVLIEAVKELNEKVNTLENKLKDK